MIAGMQPLQGIRVVAVEQAVAAPLCTRHLAEMGASIVKIERPGSGDFARSYDTVVHGQSSHFVWLNHGKRSLELDLQHAEGRAVFMRLLAESDVLVSNLGPGSIDRIVSPEQLEEVNPRLIHCTINGYGYGGSYEQRKAYDLLVQGEAGVTANTGVPDAPAKPGVSLADLGAGTYALAGILAALRERDRTGRGARFNISLFDVVTEWMMPLLLAQRYGGSAPQPAGTHHASIVPYGAFRLADGTWLNLAVQNDRQWQAMCRSVLDAEELLDDERFAQNEGRLAAREEIVKLIADRLASMDPEVLITRLDETGIPWGRLNDLVDVVDHPQLLARDRWRTVKLGASDGPEMVSLESPLSDLGGTGKTPVVPDLGSDNHEVLTELGFGDEEIAALERAGVTGTTASRNREEAR